MTYTSDQIEALDFHDIPKLQEVAKELHSSTGQALQLQNSQDVNDQEQLRFVLRLKIDESLWYLSSQIADFEALKKELRIVKGYAGSDLEKIKSHRFNLLIAEKQLREESRSRSNHS